MTERICAVCGRAFFDDEPWKYHLRLDAYICRDCPLTNVRGEDVSQHTLLWGRQDTLLWGGEEVDR